MQNKPQKQISDGIIARALTLLRLDAGLRKKVLNTLDSVESRIINSLMTSGIAAAKTKPAKDKKINEFGQKVQSVSADGYDKIILETNVAADAIADKEVSFLSKLFNKTLKAALTVPALKKAHSFFQGKKALIFGNTTEERFRGQRDELRLKVIAAARQGAYNDDSSDDMAEAIAKIMKIKKDQAATLVNTMVSTAANNADHAFYESNDDLISGIQHVSILDTRTSEICMALDNKIWTLDRKPVGHKYPYKPLPLHWRERSKRVPVLNQNAKGLPDETRQSMAGEIPSDESFEDFLLRMEKVQPGFADTNLGKGRADLWRSGKLSFAELFDQSGNFIELEQLQ